MIKFPRWSCALPYHLKNALAWLSVVTLLTLGGSHAKAVHSAIYGGGPFYVNAASHITEIKTSGFEEAIVWNIAVNTGGDLNFNYEFLLCSGGAYVGNSTHSDFSANMAALKQGTILKRLTFSVGSSNTGVFQAIRDLINAQGTGSTSILYRNFQALKAAVPSVDAIDFDDENCYDQASMVKFAVMLGELGYKVSLCPYTNSSFWKNVASAANIQRPGTIDRINLQCYAGGGGNSPNATWNFGAVPVIPGLWDNNSTPSAVQTKMAGWKTQYGITGGFMWLYDDFVGNGKAAQYASAINAAIGTAPTVNGTNTAAATMGTAFSYQITATESPNSYGATGLPPGLTVNTSTGVVSGTPTQGGTFNATVSATNQAGTGSATLTITVQSQFMVWQNRYFTASELGDASISGPGATPANDGITNLLKYALGIDPKTNGVGGLPKVGTRQILATTYLTLAYTKVLVATDVTYTVEVSGDMVTWSSGTSSTGTVSTTNNPDGTTQTIVVRDFTSINSTAKRFIRLRVSQP